MVWRPLVVPALLGLAVAGCRGANESLKEKLEAMLSPDTVAALKTPRCSRSTRSIPCRTRTTRGRSSSSGPCSGELM